MKKQLLLASAVLFGALTAVGQCLLWQAPTPSTGVPPFPTGWTDFNSQFGGAPCTANPPTTFEITAFEIWAAEAYQMNNIIAGGQYRFSACNGPGAGTWPVRFTILTPTGTVDAFGIDPDGCSLTWTASQTGSYTIVVNQSGSANCGGGPNQSTDNGFPAITYLGGATCPSAPTCDAGDLVAAAVQNVCGPNGTATISTTGVSVPTGGRTGVYFRPLTGGTGALGGSFVLFLADASSFPYTFDNNLNGVLSNNGFPPFAGSWTAKVFVSTTTSFASICDTTAAASQLNFVPVSDPSCAVVTTCDAGDLVAPATQALCPNDIGTVSTTGTTIPNSPTAGDQGVLFRPGVNGAGALGGAFILTGVTFPYNFNADLNGVLSANSFPPLTGTWNLRPTVSADVAAPFASICDSTATATAVTFNIAGSPQCAPPANDSPCTPTAIACGNQLAGTTFNATQSIPAIACDGFTAASALDVWYSFSSNGTLSTAFTVNGFDAVLAIYSAGNCNSLGAALICSDDEFTATETIDAGVLPAGNYLLRVYSFFAADAGGFSVTMDCVCPLGPPGTPCDDGDPNTTNDQVTANCTCVGTPISGCTVDGGTISTTSPRLNLCVGDGEPNIISLTVTGNTTPGRFGLVTSPALNVVATNNTGVFNMESFPPGNYFVGYVAVESLTQLSGVTNVSQLSGCFDLSNQLAVSSFGINGGVITANGPTTLCPGTLSFNVTGNIGPNFRWAVLNQTVTTVLAQNNTGVFNFATLGPGIYRVVHIAYGPGVNLGTIDPQNPQGCINSSNVITVTIQNCPTPSITFADDKTFTMDDLSKNLDMSVAPADKPMLRQGSKVNTPGRFDVYPNPSNGFVNAVYAAKADGMVSIRVFDMVGKVVHSQTVATNSGLNMLNLDLASLNVGVYIITIAEGDKISTERIVITR